MDLLSLGNEDCPLSVIMANLICRIYEPFSFSLCYSFLFAALLGWSWRWAVCLCEQENEEVGRKTGGYSSSIS